MLQIPEGAIARRGIDHAPSTVSCLWATKKSRGRNRPVWLPLMGLTLLLAAALTARTLMPSSQSLPADSAAIARRCCMRLARITTKAVTPASAELISVDAAHGSPRRKSVHAACWNIKCDTANDQYEVLIPSYCEYIIRLRREHKGTAESMASGQTQTVSTSHEAIWLGAKYLGQLGYPIKQTTLRQIKRVSSKDPSRDAWDLLYQWPSASNRQRTIRVCINDGDGGLEYVYSPDADDE